MAGIGGGHRAVGWGAFFWALAAPAAASTGATQGALPLSTSAALDLRVTVPRILRLRLIDHPGTLDVTAADIARGEVVVRGTRVEILANDRAGYVLRAELLHRAFTALELTGLARPIGAQGAGESVAMPTQVGRSRPQPARVEYRLRLAPGATPGRYAWPVALTLQEP